MKFLIYDMSFETPPNWKFRITETSSYESGKMAIISPKKVVIGVQWQPLEKMGRSNSKKVETKPEKVSLDEFLSDLFSSIPKDRKFRDLKVLERTGHERGVHQYRFFRLSFTYKKLFGKEKPQHCIGYLILCKKTKRTIGAFTNLPLGMIDEDIKNLEGPMKSLRCLCTPPV
mgnify:CR=1 FL=1